MVLTWRMPVTSRDAVPLRVVETVLEQQNRPPARRLLGVRDAPAAPSLGDLNKDTLRVSGKCAKCEVPGTDSGSSSSGRFGDCISTLVAKDTPFWPSLLVKGINSSCFSRSCA